MFTSKFDEIKNQHKKLYEGIIEYGTSGLRTRADILDHILFRMGLLAVLRSKKTNAAVGIMVTASHNPESDNGAKLVEPNGEMLEECWEKIATKVGNVEDDRLRSVLEDIIEEQNIDTNNPATVILGKDTRKSSTGLLNAAAAGVQVLGGKVVDCDVVTTPMLHYFVVCTNTKGKYGIPSAQGYLDKFSEAFRKIRGTQNRNNGKYIAELQLDAANGVGAIFVMFFQRMLQDYITINLFNNGMNGELNYMCGADHVKIEQKPPNNVPQNPNVRCVSIDGDADRIVYYYIDDTEKFHLLDGDRIATLIATYFQDLLKQSKLNLELSLIQTAYANGASTEFISKVLKVPVSCVPTGVKHLHRKALEYDIGIYFEANGHGTVVFSSHAIETIKTSAEDNSLPESEREAATKLNLVINLINQTVGDALSDMLLVETILHTKGWDLQTWEQCYTDLPSKQVKIKVKDRNVIVTTDAARKCVEPIGLQTKIDELVSKYPKGRSFVRPSGTEDIVRVYAEAENALDAQKLAAEVALAVYKLANGIGPEPIIP